MLAVELPFRTMRQLTRLRPSRPEPWYRRPLDSGLRQESFEPVKGASRRFHWLAPWSGGSLIFVEEAAEAVDASDRAVRIAG